MSWAGGPPAARGDLLLSCQVTQGKEGHPKGEMAQQMGMTSENRTDSDLTNFGNSLSKPPYKWYNNFMFCYLPFEFLSICGFLCPQRVGHDRVTEQQQQRLPRLLL